MGHRVEADFIHHYRCVVMIHPSGHRCGYVGIPKNHPLYGLGYSDTSPLLMREDIEGEDIGKRGIIPLVCAGLDGGLKETIGIDVYFNVHGSITYAGGSNYPIENPDELWWFGYDCCHWDDAPDLDLIENPVERAIREDMERQFPTGGIVRSRQFCENECRNLADQLYEVEQLVVENINLNRFLTQLGSINIDTCVKQDNEARKDEKSIDE